MQESKWLSDGDSIALSRTLSHDTWEREQLTGRAMAIAVASIATRRLATQIAMNDNALWYAWGACFGLVAIIENVQSTKAQETVLLMRVQGNHTDSNN